MWSREPISEPLLQEMGKSAVQQFRGISMRYGSERKRNWRMNWWPNRPVIGKWRGTTKENDPSGLDAVKLIFLWFRHEKNLPFFVLFTYKVRNKSLKRPSTNAGNWWRPLERKAALNVVSGIWSPQCWITSTDPRVAIVTGHVDVTWRRQNIRWKPPNKKLNEWNFGGRKLKIPAGNIWHISERAGNIPLQWAGDVLSEVTNLEKKTLMH